MLEYILDPELEDRLFFVSAINGSGKTLSFLIPSLLNINVNKNVLYQSEKDAKAFIYYPQVIIIADTGMLIEQIAQVVEKLAPATWNCKPSLLYGRNRLDASDHFGHILISTPNLLAVKIQNQSLSLDNVKLIAVDEADRCWNAF